MKKLLWGYGLALAVIALTIGGFAFAQQFYLPITVDQPITAIPEEPQDKLLSGFPVIKELTGSDAPLNATTTTATSSAIEIVGAKKVSLFFQRTVHGSGSSAFSVWASHDDENYFQYNKLIDNVTNSNSQDLTRVASKTISATSTAPTMVTMDLEHDSLSSIQIIVNETTDGTHTAEARIEY